jgi:thiol-disulfide isomerase/thioredoxin
MSRLRLKILVGVLAIGAVASLVFLYGKKGDGGNRSAHPCADAAPQAEGLKPLAVGEIAALQPLAMPVAFPPVQFDSARGPLTLADFAGRVVVLNLWATWCVPCREEMPALDLLQQKLGGSDFEVLAVNMDTRNVERVPKWLDENKITALTRYSDPAGKVFQTLRAQGRVQGLPTTFVLNRQGCLLAEMAGPANWASEDALALLRKALQK